MFFASVMPSSHRVLWGSLLLLPSIFLNIRDFSNELAVRIGWPKYWSFRFSISPSNEYSRFISFMIDWFGLFTFQATLRSLLQHPGSKASVLQHCVFFPVQLSQPFVTTGKTIALTIGTFVGRVMSLLFKTLSRIVIITFLSRSNRLLISSVITICSDFETREEEISDYFHFSPFYLLWNNGARYCDLRFVFFFFFFLTFTFKSAF